MPIPRSSSSPCNCSAVPDTYTPCPSPTTAFESKITRLTSGRTAMFSECRLVGLETQRNAA